MHAFTRNLSGVALLALAVSGVSADFQGAFKPASATKEAAAAQAPTAQPEAARSAVTPPAAAQAAAAKPATPAAGAKPAAQAGAVPAGQVAAHGAYAKYGAVKPATAMQGADTVAQPAPPEVKPDAGAEIARGEALYRSGKILQAAQVFEDRALAGATPTERSSTLFRLGVQWQGEASRVPAHQRADVRTAAIRAYRQTLEINPNSGAALNNLAQVLRSDPTKTGDADSLLARAIALNDARKGVYLMNRAALKRDTGDLAAAADFAKQAAADDKGNLAAHQLVMSLLEKRQDAAALLDYIRDLESRGLVVRALDSATEGMAKLPAARADLLISVARTIGNASYTADPWAFEKTNAGVALASYRSDPAIGTGVSELFGVLQSPVAVTSLQWWRKGFNGDFDAASNSPAEALQALAFRCGEIYQAAGDKRAEGYYRMSVDISGRASTDPRALLGLAELLYEQKRFDDLAQVLRENEPGLMEAKGHAIAASDFLHTYQLRLALGMMYGYNRQWTNSRQNYAASIWMLEHARESAARYNADARLPRDQQVKLPPSAVKMLSTGYANTNRIDRSVETRIDFANLYLSSGQKRFAQQVLDTEWQKTLPDTVSAPLRQRLAEVTAKAGS